jgi:hypothetical protein
MRKGVLALVIIAALMSGPGRATAAVAPPPEEASCIAVLASIYAGGNVDEAVAQFQALAAQQGITFGQLLARLAQAHGTVQECLALPPNP